MLAKKETTAGLSVNFIDKKKHVVDINSDKEINIK